MGVNADIEAWEDDLLERYPEPGDVRGEHTFRDYAAQERPSVKEFYRLNHINQTFDFAVAKRAEYGALDHAEMGVWEAMEFLNNLVDDSDPDTDATQIEHLLQTSEAIRADGHPNWLVAAGAVHDLGKILCLWGEPQWAVVGDTYPLGCPFDERIVFSEFFADNPDTARPEFQASPTGIYTPGCGFDNVVMSWGHDEYISRVVRDYLPDEATYILRYHSFYPWHREGAYTPLEGERDRELKRWVNTFNRYDLYTKTDVRPDPVALRPFYEELFAEFFPAKIRW